MRRFKITGYENQTGEENIYNPSTKGGELQSLAHSPDGMGGFSGDIQFCEHPLTALVFEIRSKCTNEEHYLPLFEHFLRLPLGSI